MMRSMYSAVSGLRIHQTKMDVIGNNIANVNTVGFKKAQVTFQEVFSQVVRGASAPTGGKGGTNPQQIGLGVSLGSINTIHTKGPSQRTDNPTDLMIDGEGFFVVSDDVNFNNRYYTRAGNFSLDMDGNLVTFDGHKVLGYAADENGNITNEITNIKINMSETKAPTATSGIIFKGNLDSRLSVGSSQSIDTVIYDNLGNSYTLTFDIVKGEDVVKEEDIDGDGNLDRVVYHTWTLSLSKITDRATGNYTKKGDNDFPDITQALIFKDGKLQVENENYNNNDNKLSLTISGSALTNIKFAWDKENNQINNNLPVPSGTFSDIIIFDPDSPETYKDVHQYANEFGFKPYAMNGNTSGTLEGFAIDATGTVVGVFTNGERKALGQIMLAKFDNPMGLQKLGGNLFIDTRNSGEPQYGKASVGGFGAISPGNLEMSNVDIALEFTEMITTQRGFQANSRIITTSDEMLQELVNMKR